MTAIAVIFRNDAQTRRNKEKKQRVKNIGQRISKLYFPFSAILNMTATITPRINWPNDPTARSEKARLSRYGFP